MTHVYIHAIETKVPGHRYAQGHIKDRVLSTLNGHDDLKAVIERLYSHTGIDNRYFSMPGLMENRESFYFTKDSQWRESPSSGERNNMYIREASPLFVEAARKAIAASNAFSESDITHVITVSCTGFFAPGPDFTIMTELGLPPHVRRYHLGFMGCYAAMPAMRMAMDFCKADPEAVVLIVCAELCSLHFQPGRSDLDAIVATAIFADGAAGVIVSAKAPVRPAFELIRFDTHLCKNSGQDMTWAITDTGFDIKLSRYVPKIIEMDIQTVIGSILQKEDLSIDDVGLWALHPGGKAIVDGIERQLALSPEKLGISRKILRDFGNMSSATVLFVLKDMLDGINGRHEPSLVCSMAFGPGVTMEAGLLKTHRPASLS